MNLEIQRSQYIKPKVKVHKGAETIQGRKLFKGGNYPREETIQGRKLYGEIRYAWNLVLGSLSVNRLRVLLGKTCDEHGRKSPSLNES